MVAVSRLFPTIAADEDIVATFAGGITLNVRGLQGNSIGQATQRR